MNVTYFWNGITTESDSISSCRLTSHQIAWWQQSSLCFFEVGTQRLINSSQNLHILSTDLKLFNSTSWWNLNFKDFSFYIKIQLTLSRLNDAELCETLHYRHETKKQEWQSLLDIFSLLFKDMDVAGRMSNYWASTIIITIFWNCYCPRGSITNNALEQSSRVQIWKW